MTKRRWMVIAGLWAVAGLLAIAVWLIGFDVILSHARDLGATL